MLNQAPAPQAKPNVITHEEIMEVAKQLGADSARGKDTQVKSLLKCIEGAYHGALDLKKNKHGADRDDASLYAEHYWKAGNANAVFNYKDDNQQKLASTIRTSIKLGGSSKFGNGEPIVTVNKLMTTWQKLRAGPERKRLDDAANTLMKYARTQLKRDRVLSDDERREMGFRPGKTEATVEEILEATRKKLDKLINGTLNGGAVQCKSPHIIAARHSLSQELAAIAKAKNPNIKQSA